MMWKLAMWPAVAQHGATDTQEPSNGWIALRAQASRLVTTAF
jgi:hypothetical protein